MRTTPPPQREPRLMRVDYLFSQFADNYNIKHFFEVSAKSGDYVSEAFEEFFVEVHRKVHLCMQPV